MARKVRIKKRTSQVDKSENEKNTSKQSNSNSNCNSKTNTNYLDLGLDRFSYADFVLLSSLLAYSIGEELNDSDLDLLIVFFSIVSSDLALIRTKRGVVQRKQATNQNSAESAPVDTITQDGSESIVSDLSRKNKTYKKICTKKRKRVTKSMRQ